MDDAIGVYETQADRLIAAWSDLDPAEVLLPVSAHLRAPPCRVLDCGAGPGLLAAWFAARGDRVLAAEPVAGFRAAGAHLPDVEWSDARLPGMAGVTGVFDIVLAAAVLHHLPPADRDAALRRLASLTGAGGQLVLSLRHGGNHAGRPVWPLDPDAVAATVQAQGLEPAHRVAAGSAQTGNRVAGVTWTWLVFRRP